jgi:protein O-GlcNAc transferase
MSWNWLRKRRSRTATGADECARGLARAAGHYATGHLEAALDAYAVLVAGCAKNDPAAWQAYAGALKDAGHFDECLEATRRARALDPGDGRAASALLMLASYREIDLAELSQAHRNWARRFAPGPGAKSVAPPAAGRRLRVGYLSADFRSHVCAFFIEPVLRHHDRSAFEVFCYSNHAMVDGVSARLRSLAEHWRDVHALDDDACAAAIRADQLDLLVDLSGHSRGNRLPMLARRVAPVQATYLGYVFTTGVDAIDYRITDRQVDPPGESERYNVEKLVRLPNAYWCFQAPPLAEPGPLPAQTARHVTFGSLNNFLKVTDATIDLWAGILRAVDRSRLLIASAPFGERCERTLARFEAQGISRERISMFGRLPLEKYAALLRAVDVALDTYPYGGGATTCTTLWMGIPVVSRCGANPASRSGLSLLQQIGHADWVATDEPGYVAIAAGLASDLPRLATLRATLRADVASSPLCDGLRFTRGLEQSYREMLAQS